MKDFREFLLRGNLVDTAVGIVIGLAFAAVVTALVADLITPLIAAIGGQSDALIALAVIAAVIFFLVVKPVNALMKRYKAEPPVGEAVRQCPHCLSEIPIAASRCAFCTQEVAGGTVTA
jgi:large conductance mechanosensitive channel